MNIINTIRGLLFRLYRLLLLPEKYLTTRKIALIENPQYIFEIICKLNENKWEDICLPEIFDVSKGIKTRLFYKEQFVLRIENAVVSINSNIIETEEGVVWNKFCNDIFPLTIPLDKDLYDYDNKFVRVRKKRSIIHVKGAVLSLLGVHSLVWSHFLIQYLPKLFYAEQLNLIDGIDTLIIPHYSDPHIKMIVDHFAKSHAHLKVIEASDRAGYKCENLIFIPETSLCGDHSNMVHICETIIPHETFDLLYRNLAKHFLDNIKLDIKCKKIYLVRRGTYRTLINVDEIENFFKERGFILIEPHKMTFEEKVRAFYSADIIAGPVSAAFTNILFCRCDNTKLLILSSLTRAFDGFTAGFANYKKMMTLRVTGRDCSSELNSSYYINITKLEEAYCYLTGYGE